MIPPGIRITRQGAMAETRYRLQLTYAHAVATWLASRKANLLNTTTIIVDSYCSQMVIIHSYLEINRKRISF